MINLLYLFESYPVFYQPYIDTVVNSFLHNKAYEFKLKCASKNETKFKKKMRQFSKAFDNKFSFSKSSIFHRQLLNCDIVHVQHSFLFPHLKTLLSHKTSQTPKTIITLRGADTYIKPLLNQKWSNFYKEDLFDAYVVMSRDQQSKLESLGVNSKKIHVIPISFGDAFVVNPKSVNTNKIKVLSAFRLCWEKNINGNLLVIKELVEQGYPVEYDIYGSGTEQKMLLYLIDKYKLKNHVFYKGSIPNEKLKTKLPSYDFYLQLSLSESFGMSVVEAQTFGLPAITSNVGGLPDIVVNNKTGFTVEPNDYKSAAHYIIKLWENSEKYTLFSTRAIKQAQENFNTQKEVTKLDELYKSLVNEK